MPSRIVATARRSLGAVGAAAFFFSGVAHATDFKTFNAFVRTSFEGNNSDVEGRLAAGGNVTLHTYGVAHSLNSSANGTTTLLVGGTLTYNNGELKYGNAQAASFSGNFTAANGSRTTGSFDATADFAKLTEISRVLGTYAATGTAVAQYGGVTMTASNSGLVVFTVSGSDLAGAGYTNITVPDGAYVLVNVVGPVSGMHGGLNITGTTQDKILYNFADASSLTFSGIGIKGSILAPKATVNFDNGQMNGVLLANAFKGTGELHNTGYAGSLLDIPVTIVAPVPEPATWAMMIGGFGLIGFGMRRRRASEAKALAA